MDRLTNDETYSILKMHLEGTPSWADIVNQKEKIYVALAEYEKTGLKADEIEKLKQENANLRLLRGYDVYGLTIMNPLFVGIDVGHRGDYTVYVTTAGKEAQENA